MKRALLCAVSVAILGFVSAPARSDEAKDKKGLEEWMKMAEPAPEVKLLEPIAGQWKYYSKFWPAPGAEPIQGKGLCTRAFILGDRFLQEDVEEREGPGIAGRKFSGLGLMGYD